MTNLDDRFLFLHALLASMLSFLLTSTTRGISDRFTFAVSSCLPPVDIIGRSLHEHEDIWGGSRFLDFFIVRFP